MIKCFNVYLLDQVPTICGFFFSSWTFFLLGHPGPQTGPTSNYLAKAEKLIFLFLTQTLASPLERQRLLCLCHMGDTPLESPSWVHGGVEETYLALRGGRLTSLDASWARCFVFFQTSSKTSRSMFFSKHRWNIASLSKKCDVFHDVLGFRKATQSRS